MEELLALLGAPTVLVGVISGLTVAMLFHYPAR